MSDSGRPHRRQPNRLPRPWDSPGKNTGVGCHFLFQCRKVKSESEVAQSCPTLATPWTAAYQAPPSMGFSKQEYWSGMPSPSPSKLFPCCCSVTQLCPTVCDPMDCGMPGHPHYVLEFAQTHVIDSMIPSNHRILCHPLFLLSSILPSIRVFSNESALPVRCPKY